VRNVEDARSLSDGIVVLVRGWAPFVALLAAYELMRDLASSLGIAPHDLAPLDRTLFAGYQPTLVLQATVSRLTDADLLEDAASLIYGAHFLLPVVVGAWLWMNDGRAFGRFGMTLVVLCALAFVTYVVAPTAPPWLAQPAAIHNLLDDAIRRAGLPAGLTWLYSHHDYNLYAAFPSLHAGFPVVAAAAAWQRNRTVGVLLGVWAVIVWVVVVYLGEHYVADVLGGIAYAVAAIAITRMVAAKFPDLAVYHRRGGRSPIPQPR
jgi:hypothetical protein